jgi:hypothetical protein
MPGAMHPGDVIDGNNAAQGARVSSLDNARATVFHRTR